MGRPLCEVRRATNPNKFKRDRNIGMMLKSSLIKLITLYQFTLSALIGRQCRFEPSCSNYTKEAIELHGSIKGLTLVPDEYVNVTHGTKADMIQCLNLPIVITGKNRHGFNKVCSLHFASHYHLSYAFGLARGLPTAD